MKYQCNACGRVHDYLSEAVNCHPDINEIPDEQLESRLAAQHSVHLTPMGVPQVEEDLPEFGTGGWMSAR